MFRMIPVLLLKLLLIVHVAYGSLLVMSSCDDGNKPAFLASLTNDTPLNKDMVVKFDYVQTNNGNGYNPSTGIFTVQLPGVYQFSCNFIKSDNSFQLELGLMKNEQVVVRAHSIDAKWATGSLQAILNLERGDRIYIQHLRSDGGLNGGHYSMFSGHQI